MATCPEKQVVLSLLCSMLNTVACMPPNVAHVLTSVDPEVQPCNMASTIRPCCIQGPAANPCHILPTAPSGANLVSYSRSWQWPCSKELLQTLPWSSAPPARLPVPSRRHDENLEPACMFSMRHCWCSELTFRSFKPTHLTCLAATNR